jgi:hypothetical protein
MSKDQLVAVALGIGVVLLLAALDVFQFLSMQKITKDIERLFKRDKP